MDRKLRGSRYTESAVRGGLELCLVPLLHTAALASRSLLRVMARNNQKLVIDRTPRIGEDGETISMFQYALRNRDDNGRKAPLPKILYGLGIDETAQLHNIVNGTMRIFGRRPHSPGDFADFMGQLTPDQRERYKAEVLPCKPGILSSYAVKQHQMHPYGRPTAEERFDLDMADTNEASLGRDINIICGTIGMAAVKLWNAATFKRSRQTVK